MAGSNIGDTLLARADVADLKAWMVGLSLVVVLNVVGTAGAIVAVVLTR